MRDARQELVRIDVRGEAHPIGVVASQRMRARAGAYRCLPSPGHVVFMRYTGEDGRRDSDDGAIVRIAGEITAPGTVCDVLALVAQTGWRGELVVLDGDTERSIFFDSGNIVGGQTNVEDERLGSVMYRYGAITDEQLERVAAITTGGRRFGELTVELGILSQEQVYTFLSKQAEEIVFSSFSVGDGTFFFLDGFDESRLVSRHAVSANALLMDGVTRMDEMRYFRQKIPSNDFVPVRTEGRSPPPQGELTGVYDAVDGKLSIEEIGRATGLGEFETTKRLYALVQSRHVVIYPPRASGGPAALAETANNALRAVLEAADAGGRGREVRESLSSFAVGAGVYDILFRGAGPDTSGALDADRVAENAVIVAAGANSENLLKQMLNEYVSFALFSAGAALGSDKESELRKSLTIVMTALRPHG
jgi:hypothetical protein